ncbi:UNVERIFIED_CONTAM: hypothetical protein FKN15_025786 [Acipenser sinensis]
MCRQPTAFFHTADSPCSHPRATASEDNAALGSLQASPQAPGQTTGVTVLTLFFPVGSYRITFQNDVGQYAVTQCKEKEPPAISSRNWEPLTMSAVIETTRTVAAPGQGAFKCGNVPQWTVDLP